MTATSVSNTQLETTEYDGQSNTNHVQVLDVKKAENISEYDFFGKELLSIDLNHLRLHKNTQKKYQVYYGGESISESEDTLILRHFIGYNGCKYICRFHKGKNCPGQLTKLQSNYRATIFNHVASYFFTYRCQVCTKKYNTLTNLSAHLNNTHYSINEY